jgi:uncharacterized protein
VDNKSLPSVPLQKSRFLHLFQKDQVFCLQHNLTLEKVYGGRILQLLYECYHNPRNLNDVLSFLPSEFAKDIVEESISLLYKRGLLVEDDNLDNQLYLVLTNAGCNRTPISLLYLIPTIDCNFKCQYCFVKNKGKPSNGKLMNIDMAINGIDLFAKLTEEIESEASITYYGGEPLLNAEVVYGSMKYIRELEEKGIFRKPVTITIITNGSLINERTLEAIAENKPLVSVSIDGPAHLHDAARKDLAGNGTFARALAGYRKLKERGIECGISCTISQSNLEHIDEVIDFILTELKTGGMGFNIILPQITPEANHSYDYELAARQVIRAFEVLREHGVYEDRMMRRVKPYINKTLHLKDCLGVGGQLVLTPEGRIGPCQALLGMGNFFPLTVDELYGKISTLTSDDIYANPLFDEWRHRFPLNMKDCLDCFAIGVCGGGCPYAALVDYGSIWEIDRRICHQAKLMLEWMIWDTYDHLMESINQLES